MQTMQIEHECKQSSQNKHFLLSTLNLDHEFPVNNEHDYTKNFIAKSLKYPS